DGRPPTTSTCTDWRRRVDAARIFRMREFSAVTLAGIMFPIPITKAAEGFELVLDMLEDGCEGILAHLGK
ncbi:MAG: hypothetical protein ACLUQ6_08750, partial [Alistipes onderdonkii]